MEDKKKNKKENGKIIEKHFEVDPDFKDPLDKNNIFEEIEVEEIKSYFNVHLGVPLQKSEH